MTHRERIRDGEETLVLALEWLAERDASRPLFLWVHLFEPHTPYPLTAYAEAEFERTGYDGSLADGATMDEIDAVRRRLGERPAELEAIRTLYRGRVMDADRLFGRLLEGVRSGPRADETLVVMTADHGELLGEHGRIGHGALFWEEAMRVPLMVAGPEIRPGRVAERVGLVDVMPTLLERLEIAAPHEMQGRSLGAALAGEPIRQALYFGEARVPAPSSNRGGAASAESVAAWRGDEKVVLHRKGPRRFDLAADPGEARPELVASGPLVTAAEAHRSGVAPEADAPLDEETREELRALGYLE